MTPVGCLQGLCCSKKGNKYKAMVDGSSEETRPINMGGGAFVRSDIATEFLQALWAEYVQGVDKGVERWLDQKNPRPETVEMLEREEDIVRSTKHPRGPAGAIADLATKWGVAPPGGGKRPTKFAEGTIVTGGASPVASFPTSPTTPISSSGRKRALLIGINYFGTSAELRGCINDVSNMKRLLTQTFWWRKGEIKTLTDNDPDLMPTRARILEGLHWLVEGAKRGDTLFLHFSGHGAQQEDPQGHEEDGMNETILPVDFKRAGMITDDQIGDIIVKGLPEGVRLTAVMDCCHSGTGLDLPYTWTLRGWKEETNPFLSRGDVQLFSGCEDHATSADATMYGSAGGAMTTAFCDVMRANRKLTYSQMFLELNRLMHKRGFSQRAQLTSSQRFASNRLFTMTDIVGNSNPTYGRIYRKRFHPKPRKLDPKLSNMLGIGAAVAGGVVAGSMLTSGLTRLLSGFFGGSGGHHGWDHGGGPGGFDCPHDHHGGSGGFDTGAGVGSFDCGGGDCGGGGGGGD